MKIYACAECRNVINFEIEEINNKVISGYCKECEIEFSSNEEVRKGCVELTAVTNEVTRVIKAEFQITGDVGDIIQMEKVVLEEIRELMKRFNKNGYKPELNLQYGGASGIGVSK